MPERAQPGEAHPLAALMAYGREQLADSDSAQQELRMLLAEIGGISPARQIAFPELPLSASRFDQLRQAIDRRAAGEPLAYILGMRGFWRHAFRVSPATLIPRPETEQLVEWALELLPLQGARVADLGTGSGAIVLSLAHERPDCLFVAIDRSLSALHVADSNRRAILGLGAVERVLLLQGSWGEALAPAQFDLIVSNPPYIPAADRHLEQGDLRYEPRSALVAGDDGLADYRLLIPQAMRALKPDGWLLLEHGHDQAEAVAELMYAAGFDLVQGRRDLAGRPRNTAARRRVYEPCGCCRSVSGQQNRDD